MSDTTSTFTLEQIREHQTKKDLWMVIHDKVYSISGFVDEHPGGEEVLMDVAGMDATEAFEDVGHSDEAREILTELLVGNLKRSPSDKKPTASASKPAAAQSSSANAGVAMYGFFAVAAVGALVAYKLYA